LKTRAKIHRSRPVCWHFCWHQGEQTFAATSAIPNKGIEQMAGKNVGACGHPKLIRTDVDC
jgi:selenophosphate synthetase-related protein